MNPGCGEEITENLLVTLTTRVDSNNSNGNDILTTLPRPLCFQPGRFDVGLISLRCSPALPPTPAQSSNNGAAAQANLPADQHEPLFPGLQKPVIVPKPAVKRSKDLLRFIADLNGPLRGTGVEFSFMSYHGGIEALVTITVNAKLQESWFRISANLARILGFNRTVFYPGRYYRSSLATQKLLDAFPLQHEFLMEIITPKDTQNYITFSEEIESIDAIRVTEKPDDYKEFFNWLSDKIKKKGLRIKFVDEYNRPCKFQENTIISVQLQFKSRF